MDGCLYVKAYHVATPISFKERDAIKHFPENDFVNDCIFLKVQINPLGKTHECLICK